MRPEVLDLSMNIAERLVLVFVGSLGLALFGPWCATPA
jgi:hypothetical protein